MSYLETIEADLARARMILADGKAALNESSADWQPEVREYARTQGGTIYGKDIYAAYKLLESFVAELERRRTPPLRSDIQQAVKNVRAANTLDLAIEIAIARLVKPFVERPAEHTHITWNAAGVRVVNGVPDGGTDPVCQCGTVMVCPDLGCDRHKRPEAPQTFNQARVEVAEAEAARFRAALQTVMQVLGPTGVPTDVDYGDKWNLAGLSCEVDEALRACRSVGIEFQSRKRTP